MGFLFSSPKPQQPNPKTSLQSQVQNVDVIKVKLKHVRDRLKQYINLKTKQEQSINQKIKQLVPEYQQTGSKKKMIPYLNVKKNIKMNIEQAEIQLNLILEQLSQVQINQMNKQTIDAVDEANKHVEEIMKEMQAKDWQKVLYEAQQKYELDWPQDQENLQDDPVFQEMWKEMGGDKLDTQTNTKKQKKVVEGKKVHAQIHQNTQVHSNADKAQQFA